MTPFISFSKPTVLSGPAPQAGANAHVYPGFSSGIQKTGAQRVENRLVRSRTLTDDELADQIFSALARVKVLTSQVAMHIDLGWRDRVFAHLDRLHDVEDWPDGDLPVLEDSYRTFLRAMFVLQPAVKPSLGLASTGNLLAAWAPETGLLTLEFFNDDQVSWAITHKETELGGSGRVSIFGLKALLDGNNALSWLEATE